MPIQTSTTALLENASREMIAQAIYSTEHNAPCVELVEKFTLKQGDDTGVFPKFGRVSMASLTEGQDIVDSEDLGMTSVSVQASEVGAKVILTDKLLRRNVAANWRSVGRQLGDAKARRMDEDVIALFTGLNGGTSYGGAGNVISLVAITGAIGRYKGERKGNNPRCILHPYQMLTLAQQLSTVGAATTYRPLPRGYSEEVMRDFWSGIIVNRIPFFETGNITIDASDDAIGAILEKEAIGVLWEQGWRQEKERDASLRAWELVMVADYAAFEHDDSRGAPLTYDATTP